MAASKYSAIPPPQYLNSEIAILIYKTQGIARALSEAEFAGYERAEG
jgi:hypothetical protein